MPPLDFLPQTIFMSAFDGLVILTTITLLHLLVLRTRVLPWDRLGRLERGRFDLPLWSGNVTGVIPAPVLVRPEEAAVVAAIALRAVGAEGVVWLDPVTLAGWKRMTLASWGQQVGVVFAPGPGGVALWCISRPRLASTQFDFGVSRRGARALADEIARIVIPRAPAPVIDLRDPTVAPVSSATIP
jgi:hypothetical protein